jgi:hypothetical protein
VLRVYRHTQAFLYTEMRAQTHRRSELLSAMNMDTSMQVCSESTSMSNSDICKHSQTHRRSALLGGAVGPITWHQHHALNPNPETPSPRIVIGSEHCMRAHDNLLQAPRKR